MVKDATDIYGNGLKLSARLYEGVATRRDVYRDDGTITKGVTFSAVVAKGDVVQIWTNSFAGAEDTIVAADDRNSTDSTSGSGGGYGGDLAIVITEPEGHVPAISTNGGTFTATTQEHLRAATVLFPGRSVVKSFVIGDASKAGALLGWDTSLGQMTTDSTSASGFPYLLLQSSTAGSTKSVLM